MMIEQNINFIMLSISKNEQMHIKTHNNLFLE